ncbi:MAG: hypothetical protein U0804_10645 [Gemmataceae bacterium]
MSDLTLRTLADDATGITDVFVVSHGWMGDLPAAKAQYDAWLTAMGGCGADLARAARQRPGFKPHVVGIHWPSLPWGDESFGGGGSFAVPVDGPADPVAALVDDYASRIVDTPKARDALQRIVTAAVEDVEPDELSPEVVQAYRELNWEADLGAAGITPAADRSGFDPQGIYESLKEDAPSFGLFGGGGGVLGVLGVLRTLSFWRMKDRARAFGESAGSKLLAKMMQAAPRHLRFHLVGHSFGCIVMAATLGGPRGRGRVARPVESLSLLQGALSLWSFCDDIPGVPGQRGYFRQVIADGRVRGPVVATQSAFDTATGKWYPLGAGVARQVAFAAPGELPKYGAIGTHGVRGPGVTATDLSLVKPDRDYAFTPGGVYNLEGSEVICNGSGVSGAHSDICHPEVAHAVWQAALTAV